MQSGITCKKLCCEAGIGTQIHYPIPPHLQEAYRDAGYAAGRFPIAEGMANRLLSLPMGPHLDDADVTATILALKDSGPRMTEATASYHRILRSTSIIGGASFINIAIGVLRTKVLAVLLGPAGVGLASLYTGPHGDRVHSCHHGPGPCRHAPDCGGLQ